MSVIGSARKRFWDENGFLIFPGFFSPEEVETVTQIHDQTWESKPPGIVVDELANNRRRRITELESTSRPHAYKVNDLYLGEPRLRSIALSEKIGMILAELLEDEPVLCNTLNFDKGSQGPDHLDTLYMTPPASVQGLCATWMALEDAKDDSGPLRYFPGSNEIPIFRFSNGSMHQVDSELPRWSDYMAGQVERRGLEEQRFLASKGDLFIWHALLLHGGCPIDNPTRSRQSLVTHFFTQSDCETGSWDLRPAPGGWWIKKPALQVPAEPIARNGELSGQPAAPRSAGRVSRSKELRDRFDALLGRSD